MRRSLIVLSLCVAFIALVVFAPLSEAMLPLQNRSTAAQLQIGGSIFDQLDSLLNNFTNRFTVNPLAPQSTATPSVKITGVKIATGGQSAASPQINVALQNGQVALDGVRVSIDYTNMAGVNVLSESTVVTLQSNEARSITFVPNGLSAGNYAIGVLVYKDGTDPSNQATPPYDAQQNAATLTIPSASPSGTGGGQAADAGSQTGKSGDILGNISPWMYFIFAMTGLISIALFFVFSQNRPGEDRYQDDHFKGGSYATDESKPPLASRSNTSPAAYNLEGGARTASTARRPRRIEVTTPDRTSDESRNLARSPPRPTEDTTQVDADAFVVGDVTSKKALRDKMRGKRGT